VRFKAYLFGSITACLHATITGSNVLGDLHAPSETNETLRKTGYDIVFAHYATSIPDTFIELICTMVYLSMEVTLILQYTDQIWSIC
jgi:hypothetical protein